MLTSSSEHVAQWDFIRGSLFPMQYPGAVPPSSPYDPIATSLRQNWDLVFRTRPDKDQNGNSLLKYQKIPSNSGLFLWLPKLSTNAIEHYGIIQPQLDMLAADYMRAGDIYSSASRGNTINGLLYKSALAIPYGDEASDYTLKVSPDIAQNFSKVRIFSGGYRLQCTSQAATNLTVNGRMSASVVSDSTDVCQRDGDAYPTTVITTAARTAKEQLKQVPVQNGIYSVAGPDLIERFGEVNRLAIGDSKGSWGLVDSFEMLNSNLNLGVFQANSILANAYNGDCFPIYNGWFSPWDVEVNQWGNNALYGPAQSPQAVYPNATWTPITRNITPRLSNSMEPIGEFDKLDFKVAVTGIPNGIYSSNIRFNPNMTFVCRVTHVFAAITDSSTGTMGYRFIDEVKTHESTGSTTYLSNTVIPAPPAIPTNAPPSTPNNALQSGTNQGQAVFEFTCDIAAMSKPSDPYVGMGCSSGQSLGFWNTTTNAPELVPSSRTFSVGKYIGSTVQISIGYKIMATEAPAGQGFVTTEGTIPTNSMKLQFTNVKGFIYAKPHGGTEEGHRGPMHITRYEALSENQDMTFEGGINMEAVQKSSLNELYKDGLQLDKAPAKLSAMSMLHALYTNSRSPFNTVQEVGKHYAKYVALANMSYEHFVAQQLHDGCLRPEDRAARLADTEGVITQAGTNMNALMHGGGEDDPVEGIPATAGGQFGSMGYAGGQFGAGSASGQFGCVRRPRYGLEANAGFFGDIGDFAKTALGLGAAIAPSAIQYLKRS
jgi:hypothetical protein